MSVPPERMLSVPLLWTNEKHAPVSSVVLQEGTLSSSDEALMEALKQRNHNALAELFRRYARLVLSIGYRVLQDAGEAEEIVQDVFFYLFDRAGQFDQAKGSAKAWMVQVAYSRSLDRRSFLERRQFYAGTDLADFADALAGGNDIERKVVSKWNLLQLQIALRELPEKQRRTLELFFFDGLELKEITKHLEESLENVRHYYYRGLQKLRKNGIVQSLKSREIE